MCVDYLQDSSVRDVAACARRTAERMISGFRREVDETCALLGYYQRVVVSLTFMYPWIVSVIVNDDQQD